MIINGSKTGANLSKLVDRVLMGEKVIIAKKQAPLVELIVHKPEKKRKSGLLKGNIHIPDDFIDERSEINDMFFGDDHE